MKRFAWPLQRLLDVTGQKELAARAAVAEVNGQIALTREAIARRLRMLQDLLAQMAGQDIQARINGQSVWLACTPGKDRHLVRLQGRLAELEQAKAERMRQLAQLRQQRRTYEKLREEAQKRYSQELNRFEQAQLDESATVRFALRLAEQPA